MSFWELFAGYINTPTQDLEYELQFNSFNSGIPVRQSKSEAIPVIDRVVRRQGLRIV
jgi:hypothetical protein